MFGTLDVFNALALNHSLTLPIVASTLEPVSTQPRGMNQSIQLANFSQSIVPTHTFADPPENLDVLIVPGGLGTRAQAPALLDAIDYIKDVFPSLDYLLTVCTGAALAARSGVLDGRNATTNKVIKCALIDSLATKSSSRWLIDGLLHKAQMSTGYRTLVGSWMETYGRHRV